MNAELFLDISPVIQVHWVLAIAALLLGIAQLMLPKGTALHKWIGWGWVMLMAVVAVTAIGVREANTGAFSPIHVFVVVVLIGLPIAIRAIRQGDVRRHAITMVGLFIGGLVVAGGFALFSPERIFYQIVLS